MAATTPRSGPDRGHLEMRLLVVAEMLENAVAEVHRVMAEIKDPPPPPASTPPQPRSTDAT